MTHSEARPRCLPSVSPGAHPRQILRLGIEAAGGPVGLACSFSVEDVVIVDLLQEAAPQTRVFALDTGRLPEETYEVAQAVADRYRLTVHWYFPRRKDVERLERERGLYSFRESLENRHECCHIRKVEPLGRALQGLGGWITGLRRAQSPTRVHAAPLEIDRLNGDILKINPLLEWTDDQVWEYARSRHLPVNRLYRLGYRSIGCAPCTRPLRPGESPRAGRWWWEDPEHKECGLHRR
ncbi:MAG: phosphoadenylyl-sulfate reductase [Deferrisomatales bacterium]